MVESAGMKPAGKVSINRIQEPLPPANSGSRWQHFVSMPHHVLFSLGSLQTVVVMLWWLVDLGGRYGGLYAPVVWSIPSPWAHLYLMIFGLFPLYMFGFLMTTYPKWMAGVPVASKHYLSAAALLGLAMPLGYVGLATSKPLLLIAMGLHLAGWAAGLYALLRVYIGAERPDILHAKVTSGVLLLGLCLLLVLITGITLDNTDWIAAARIGGIWWFLFPVFFAVSHRLIPFFSSVVLPDYEVIRPDWTLWLMAVGGLLHGIMELIGLPGWVWLVDIPMAATAFWLTSKWRLKQSFHVRILAMLHIAFAWLGIALALYGIQSLLLLLGTELFLNRAPLHALMVGYFASMLVAMATRVTLGHSGRPLTADSMAWTLFLAVQAAALVRVLADLPVISAYAAHLYLCSAVLWLIAFGGWLIKFTPIFWNKP
jgi:uncharacterized protein involved in response to NO